MSRTRRLAASLGLSVPEVRVIEVSHQFINQSPELQIEIAGHRIPCSTGLQLGSRYVADPYQGMVSDYLSESMLKKVINRFEFHRILAFDKWAGNCDSRQAVFTRRPPGRGWRANFIDQGHCFDAGEWTFPDLALHGVYHQNQVYEDITGWESFEPVLSRIEHFDYADLWICAAEIPHEWFEHDGQGLFDLVEALYRRRSLVRELITQFRNSARNPFPNWTDSTFAFGLVHHDSTALGVG